MNQRYFQNRVMLSFHTLTPPHLVRSVGIHAGGLSVQGLAQLHHIPPGALHGIVRSGQVRDVHHCTSIKNTIHMSP